MSETLKSVQETNEHYPLQGTAHSQENIENQLLMQGDRGAINTEVLVRGAEAVREGFTSARIAFHGLAERVRERRGDWADRRREKMDHKDRLYAHLGTLAVDQHSAGPRPRSFVERVVDTRLEDKRAKASVKTAKAKRTNKAFGVSHNPQLTRPSANPGIKRRVGDSLGVTPDGYRGAEGLSATARVRDQIRKEEIDRKYRKREIPASERREQRLVVDTEPTLTKTKAQKRVRRGQVLSDVSLELARTQPISSRWRTRRRHDAIKDSQRHRNKAQKHRDIVEELQN